MGGLEGMASTKLHLGSLEAPSFLAHGPAFSNQLNNLEDMPDGNSGLEVMRPLPSGLQNTDFDSVRKRLACAVVRFQEKILHFDLNAGSLCQVWLPDHCDGGCFLKTKGLPFCVAGVGDLLALFRCVSCRYSFGTDVRFPDKLGAPGRVFTTGEPEMSSNVQKYSTAVYLRAAEAQQCRVHSTLVIPLFITPEKQQAVGVLEVVQTVEDMHFTYVVETLTTVLEACGLYTCDLRAARSKEMSESSNEVKALVAKGLLQTNSLASNSSDNSRDNSRADVREGLSRGVLQERPEVVDESTCTSRKRDNGSGPQQTDTAGSVRGREQATMRPGPGGDNGKERTAGTMNLRKKAQQESKAADIAANLRTQELASPPNMGGWDDADDDDIDLGDNDDDDDDEGQGKGKGGNSGKPGKKLKYEDLRSQFGVGLKEAASRLGICPTTLKRACRRHGIQRWPRRTLLKLQRALDQISATGTADLAGGKELLGMPGPDTRWTCLANIFPKIEENKKAALLEDPPSPEALGPSPAPAAAPPVQAPLQGGISIPALQQINAMQGPSSILEMQGFGGPPFSMGYGNLGGMQYGFPQGLGPLPMNQAHLHPSMTSAQVAFQQQAIQQAQQGIAAYTPYGNGLGVGMLFQQVPGYPTALDAFPATSSIGLPSGLDDDDIGIGTSLDCLEHILSSVSAPL
eukprot:jgi/Botrbrau1/12576/Bobra.0169s0109.2